MLAYPWVRRTPYSGEEREGRLVRGNLEVKRHRFTAREFRAMAEAGVLGEDDRVELVDGEIVDMAPIGSRHLSCVVALTHLLVELAQGRYFVSVQNPVRLSERDEPQPDLTLLRRRPDPAAPSPPNPEDVLAVVEVSDTTLSYDRNVKLPLYARAGISEAWVIDLKAGNVEVHSEPSPEGYGESHAFGSDECVASGTVEGLSVPVDEVLG
jgi:Uma2 family endonuclease